MDIADLNTMETADDFARFMDRSRPDVDDLTPEQLDEFFDTTPPDFNEPVMDNPLAEELRGASTPDPELIRPDYSGADLAQMPNDALRQLYRQLEARPMGDLGDAALMDDISHELYLRGEEGSEEMMEFWDELAEIEGNRIDNIGGVNKKLLDEIADKQSTGDIVGDIKNYLVGEDQGHRIDNPLSSLYDELDAPSREWLDAMVKSSDEDLLEAINTYKRYEKEGKTGTDGILRIQAIEKELRKRKLI